MADLIDDVVQTIDRVAYDLVGVKPAEKVVMIAEKIAPSNVLTEVTGIAKPESTLGKVFSDVDRTASKLKGDHSDGKRNTRYESSCGDDAGTT
jgi:hypothetical protein